MSLDNKFFIGLRQTASWNNRPFACDILVFWDKAHGERGYQLIEGGWKQLSAGEYTEEYSFFWADQDPDQTDQPEIHARENSERWFWAKEPVKLFPGLCAMYVKDFFTDRLCQAADRQGIPRAKLFAESTLYEEKYGKPVRLVCATSQILHDMQKNWYNLIEKETDWSIARVLTNREHDIESTRLAWWLKYSLATDIRQAEDAVLRYLILHPQKIAEEQGFVKFLYRPQKVQGRQLDVQSNLKRAVEEMKQTILETRNHNKSKLFNF
ncbi:MAG TPA: hypothetical protein VJJ82_04610 [Candidatus Nanoarchaeia archaeon]|nr:hypothetical protein [Candidatus Nanoarchaeia archaeon]